MLPALESIRKRGQFKPFELCKRKYTTACKDMGVTDQLQNLGHALQAVECRQELRQAKDAAVTCDIDHHQNLLAQHTVPVHSVIIVDPLSLILWADFNIMCII